ncbi:hypothetical protein CS542_05930 [Pedobacter sp. IW39]|nr:hypothetical protein CS542_05930 [Pedobacter sp. IW39]
MEDCIVQKTILLLIRLWWSKQCSRYAGCLFRNSYRVYEMQRNAIGFTETPNYLKELIIIRLL